MKVVILCGGKGTRIREASEGLPKPMLPIGGWPIVWHIMKLYAHFGHKQFVLCLGYRGWAIKEFFLNYPSFNCDLTLELGAPRRLRYHRATEEDWTVTLAETGEATMTGGRVWRIRPYVENEALFMVTYGDGVADLDIEALVRFHRQHGRVGTVTGVRPPGRFGEMVAEGGRVVEFNEKPQTSAGVVSGGFFVFDAKRVWDYLTPDEDLVFETSPLQNMVADGQLMVYEHRGFWQPMDTHREFQLLNELWNTGQAPWTLWQKGQPVREDRALARAG